jgi:DNA-binding LacI/PurR family transcriptional regulator
VLVDYSPHVPGPHVNIDDRGGARAVAQHLADLGHRRYGIVLPYEKWRTDIPYGGPEATAARAEEVSRPDLVTDYRRWRCFIRYERLIGWREALAPAGVDWSSVPVASAPGSDAETGYLAGAQLLDRADRPTAIICLSDVLALGVMRAAAERGVRVPQDLSVVGYDDISDARTAALTTVWQPHAAKGEEAVRLLGDGGDNVVLPTRLVVRASSGPVPTH